MVLISITLACVFLSPVTRVIFFAAAGILCAYELSRNLEKLEVGCAAGVMYVYLAAQAVLTLIDRFTGVEIGLFWYMVLFACAVYFALFAGILRKDVAGKGALGTVFGLAYPCFQFSMIMVICVSDIWLQTLAVACLSTWVCDSFALFGGKRFGKHKIAPSVSPNKTVEGCICGAISSVVTGVIVYYLSLRRHRASRVHDGADRRPRRIARKAHDRRKGLLESYPRPRRHVRPCRQPAFLHPDRVPLPYRCRDNSLI